MDTEQTAETRTEALLELAELHAAHNYHPLPVVIAEGEGAWVTDVEGNRYLDMLAAYSALNFGHRHPRLVEAAHRQLDRLTLTSRAFHNDVFPVFCRELAELAGKDMVLTMNTGAEAVETAIKTARRWGYDVKGVAPDRAKIVVADGNFHGRTVTIVSFSTDPSAKGGFGPFTPGFEVVPYGDIDALRAAIDDDTVAFLVEPIQGEAGDHRPARGLPPRRARALHRAAGAADGRRDPVGPRAAPGRRSPWSTRASCPTSTSSARRSAAASCRSRPCSPTATVLDVFRPGEHGSTFGGNPLACAIGLEVLAMLRDGHVPARLDRARRVAARRAPRRRRVPSSPRSGAAGSGSGSSSTPGPGTRAPPASA